MEQEKFDKVIDLIFKQMDLNNDFTKKFLRESLLAIQKFDTKHSEKGMGKFDKYGAVAVAMSTDDIYEQISEYYVNGKNSLNPDDVVKLWQDLGVYALMGSIIEQGEWK
jgi:uridine phosphorylase